MTVVGSIFYTSGLFVGKEGPMIHSGAIIGAGVPQVIIHKYKIRNRI